MEAIWNGFKWVLRLAVIVAVISTIVGLFRFAKEQQQIERPTVDSILIVPVKGIIAEAKRPLKLIRKYASEEHIKGILVHIDSPGGVVGPSQELYEELKRVRQVLKKPVIATGTSVMASGAYYAALGADKIYANAGTLVGSIGVIMEFANLEKLYDWAKIKRYAIKTGAYKDTGSEYRSLRPDEEKYLQTTINEVLEQFRSAVKESRELELSEVQQISDGRIFNGLRAKELGLIDEVGTYSDALRDLGKLTNLGDDPEIFEPAEERGHLLLDLMSQGSGEEAQQFLQPMSSTMKEISQRLRLNLVGKPLFLMPDTMSGQEN